MVEIKRKLFSYGTLQLADVQRALWGEAKRGRVARLIDYQLGSYPSNILYIEKKFGESVAGKIYELTEEQMEVTDAYEGKAYTRETVNIDGEVINVYVKNESIGDL